MEEAGRRGSQTAAEKTAVAGSGFLCRLAGWVGDVAGPGGGGAGCPTLPHPGFDRHDPGCPGPDCGVGRCGLQPTDAGRAGWGGPGHPAGYGYPAAEPTHQCGDPGRYPTAGGPFPATIYAAVGLTPGGRIAIRGWTAGGVPLHCPGRTPGGIGGCFP